MIRRIGLSAAVAAIAGFALASPSGAFAATTIGHNLGASAGFTLICGQSCTVAHSGLPISSQAPGGALAPTDGIVVRWRIKVGPSTSPAALRITRPGNSNTRTGAGTGPTHTPPINDTTTYDDVRLPIQAGDALGIDCCNGQSGAFFALGTTDYWQPRLLDGELARSASGQISLELLVNADIEPDADHDGYGDETQDQCPTNASTQGTCPAAPVTPVTTVKKKKCKKHKKKHSAESAKKKKCKKKKKQ